MRRVCCCSESQVRRAGSHPPVLIASIASIHAWAFLGEGLRAAVPCQIVLRKGSLYLRCVPCYQAGDENRFLNCYTVAL